MVVVGLLSVVLVESGILVTGILVVDCSGYFGGAFLNVKQVAEMDTA